MSLKKYTPKGFDNVRALSMNFAIFWFVFLLIGFAFQGVDKRFYLLFMSFLFSVYLIIPGITMFTRPWISQAWLNALHSLLIPNTPWEELPVEIKVLVFISSSISLLMGIVALILSILTV